MFDKKQWTLLVLALAEGKALTPVQLQKAMFLIGEKLPKEVVSENFYQFTPYNYGPFNSSVYDDARLLMGEGLVTISSDQEERYAMYAANEKGVKEGLGLAGRLPEESHQYAKVLVEWVKQQSFSSLVNAIYKEFPEYRINSVFKG